VALQSQHTNQSVTLPTHKNTNQGEVITALTTH